MKIAVKIIYFLGTSSGNKEMHKKSRAFTNEEKNIYRNKVKNRHRLKISPRLFCNLE